MKIKLKHSEDLDDWYSIVRAEHDGREWWESTGFMCSERLSPEACIEGDAYEMLAVAAAIKNRGAVSFKRVSVHFEPDGAHFSSPKNSEMDAVVTVEEADELAVQIFAELTPIVELKTPQDANVELRGGPAVSSPERPA